MRSLKIQFVGALLLMFAASQSFAQSPPPARVQTTESICKTLESIGPDDWVVLDLDGTVVANDHIFTNNNGLSNRLQRVLQAAGAGNHPSWVISHPLTALKSISRGSLIEECLPDRIRELQAQGTWIFVITSRSSIFSRTTLENLHSLGISLSTPQIMQQVLGPSQMRGFASPVRYRDGIFFTLGTSKGKVLKRLFEVAPVKPKYIAVYDDLEKNVNAYERALSELDVPSTIYKYLSDNVTLGEAWKLAEESLAEVCGSKLKPSNPRP